MQMNSEFDGRRSPAVRGLLVPGFTAIEQQLVLHGLRLLQDHIRMRLTVGKVRAADSETLCTHPRMQHYTVCASEAQVRPHHGELILSQVIGGHLAQAGLSFNAAQIVGIRLPRCLHVVPF